MLIIPDNNEFKEVDGATNSKTEPLKNTVGSDQNSFNIFSIKKPYNIYSYLLLAPLSSLLIFMGIGVVGATIWFIFMCLGLVVFISWITYGSRNNQAGIYTANAFAFLILGALVGWGSCAMNLGSY